MTAAGYRDFEFDLPSALLDRLVGVLDGMDSSPLLAKSIAEIPDAQGVYQLLLDGGLVYIGKTDADAGLRKRLERHGRKVQHRKGLEPARVTFKAVRIYVFTAVDLETQLRRRYAEKGKLPWDHSGFGSNDPGRNRDDTVIKANHFDALFPIDIDRPLRLDLPATGPAAKVFAALKAHVPYVFRYQASHADLKEALITISTDRLTTSRRVITEAVRQLPAGWQATRLPSVLIMYKEERYYPQGEIIARS